MELLFIAVIKLFQYSINVVLTIKASTHHEDEKKEDEYQRREISRGEYQRSFRLPGIIDSDKVKSSFKNGILELEIPKEKPAKRRSIKVE